MTSDIKITIDEWYHIEISRKMKEGKMKINNGTLIKGRSEGRTRGLNIRSPIFFGGVNSKYILSIAEDICYSRITEKEEQRQKLTPTVMTASFKN